MAISFQSKGALPYNSTSRSLGSYIRPSPAQQSPVQPKPPTAPTSGRQTISNALFGNQSGMLGQSQPSPTHPNMSVAPKQSTVPGAISSPTAATPLKKSTQTNVDGSTITHEYHAPDTGGTTGANKTTTTSSGTINPSAPTVGTQKQNAQNVLNAGQVTPLEQGFINQSVAAKNLQNYNSVAPYAESKFYNAGTGQVPDVAAPDLTGRASGTQGLASNLAGIYSNSALTGLQAANTIAGRGLTASQGVLNAGQPQFGVSPGTLVGQPLESGGGIDQNYLGGIAAPANIRSVQDFTTQINTTQKSVDTLNNFKGQLTNNMSALGFNPANQPIWNEKFSTIFQNLNPAASAGISAGLGEIKNQVSNVIASATGLTPTGVTEVVGSYDFQHLSPKQLDEFLNYIDNYAKMNIDAAQKGIDRIKTGGSASGNFSQLPEPPRNTVGGAALGTGAQAASGLIGEILNAVKGQTASGIAGGLAAKVLL